MFFSLENFKFSGGGARGALGGCPFYPVIPPVLMMVHVLPNDTNSNHTGEKSNPIRLPGMTAVNTARREFRPGTYVVSIKPFSQHLQPIGTIRLIIWRTGDTVVTRRKLGNSALKSSDVSRQERKARTTRYTRHTPRGTFIEPEPVPSPRGRDPTRRRRIVRGRFQCHSRAPGPFAKRTHARTPHAQYHRAARVFAHNRRPVGDGPAARSTAAEGQTPLPPRAFPARSSIPAATTTPPHSAAVADFRRVQEPLDARACRNASSFTEAVTVFFFFFFAIYFF